MQNNTQQVTSSSNQIKQRHELDYFSGSKIPTVNQDNYNITPSFNTRDDIDLNSKSESNFIQTINAKQEQQNGILPKKNYFQSEKFGTIGWTFLKSNDEHQKQSKRYKYKQDKSNSLNAKSDNTSYHSFNERSFKINFNEQENYKNNDTIEYDVNEDQVQSPFDILSKVQQQVHDQMCAGVINQSGQFQNQNREDESSDSKNTFSTANNQDNLDISYRPKIKGSNTRVNKQKQSSARMSELASNFQSFKKNANKLPRVSLRSCIGCPSAISIPASPRLFEKAKFNEENLKKKHEDSSYSDNQKSKGGNKNSNNKRKGSIAFPAIEKTTQQSTYIDNSSHSADLQQKNSKFQTVREGKISIRQFYEGEIENSQDKSNSTAKNQDSSSGFITETKMDRSFKSRFIRNQIKKRGLKSPEPINENSVNISNKNSHYGNNSLNHSAQANYINQQQYDKKQNLSLSSNSKICSSCHQQDQESKKQKKNKSGIEVSMNNLSCLSDENRVPEDDDLPYLSHVKDRSFDRYNSKHSSKQQQVESTIRNNEYFNKFQKVYNQKLMKGFEEADKHINSDQFKQEVLPYMEKNNSIRQICTQVEQERIEESKNINIQKLHIKKRKNEGVLQQEEEQRQAQLKLEKMKNYGRWYLKPDEFQRLVSNQGTPLPQNNQEGIKVDEQQIQKPQQQQQYSSIAHRRNASAF